MPPTHTHTHSDPEGLSPPTITTNPTSTTFTWSPPTHPNGIITHYTLHIGATVFFNGSALSLTISNDQLQLGAIYIVFLEARNSAGSTRYKTLTREDVNRHFCGDREGSESRQSLGFEPRVPGAWLDLEVF